MLVCLWYNVVAEGGKDGFCLPTSSRISRRRPSHPQQVWQTRLGVRLLVFTDGGAIWRGN
jgi:hypothetical protein